MTIKFSVNRNQFLMWFYQGLLCYSAILSFVPVSYAQNETGGPTILYPVNDDGWNHGLRKKSFSESSIEDLLELQDSEHFLWAAGNRFSNMTVHTDEDEKILSTDRFNHLLKSMACTNGMTMVFHSRSDYHLATKLWEWTSLENNNTLIMVTDYPGCTDEEGHRQPWLVDNIEFDNSKFTIQLDAVKSNWNESAATMSLDIGHYSPDDDTPDNSTLLTKKDCWIQGTCNKKADLRLNLKTRPPALSMSTFLDKGLGVSVSLAGCSSDGKLAISVHYVRKHHQTKVLTVTAVAKDVSVHIASGLSMSVTIPHTNIVSWKSKPFFTFNAPETAIEIPGIADIGPTVKGYYGFSIGSASISSSVAFACRVSLPKHATFTADLIHKKINHTSWKANITCDNPSINVAVSMSMTAYLQVAMEMSAKIFGTGWALALPMNLPSASLSASILGNPQGGVCGEKDKYVGAELDFNLGMDVSFSANQELKGDSKTLWSRNIYWNKNIFSMDPLCVAF